ncbi:MAG: 4Fe-4S binding protein [Firmicutes bacterium]|nr:4Fe-4S binding protein [Bacillota bacterium]
MGVFSLGKVVLGSLFKKPSTLMYPVIPREWEERTRGAVSINVDGCVLCGACARACPTNAIEVDRKGSTWQIERMACIQCRGCVDNCPPKCLEMDQKYTEPGGEKVIDKFDIPPRKKAAKKDAPKKDAPAKEAPKKEEAAKEAPKDEAPAKEAPAKEEPKAEAAAPAAAAAAAPAEGGLQCDVDSCVFCGACAEACPVSAIEVGDDSWAVDKDTCIECGACIDQCPAGCLSMAEAAPAEAPAAEAAPAEAAKAEEAPKAEEPAKAEEAAKEAPRAAAPVDPRLEGYVADVKEALVKEFGLSEDDAAAKLDKSGLADQLKAFPYLMNKAAKETAERIK